ncbi:MAG TPA: hypothetical protein VF516_00655 [Kofleriaceae bacterium]
MHPSASHAAIDVPALRFAILALALASWCAAGPSTRAAGPDIRPVVIRIDETTTFEHFVEETSARLGEPCLFVWGDAGELPGARPGAIAWSDGQIDGWFLHDDFGGVLRDPRVKDFVFVIYDDGTLWGSHPSGWRRWPLDIPDQPSEDRWGLLAIVVPEADPGALILPTFRAVRWLHRIAQFSAFEASRARHSCSRSHPAPHPWPR